MPKSFKTAGVFSTSLKDNRANNPLEAAHPPLEVRQNRLASAIRSGALGCAKQAAPHGLDATARVPSGEEGEIARLYKSSLEALRKGSPDLALKLISKACTSVLATADNYRLNIDLLRRQGNTDAAVRVARTWVKRNPRDACAWDFLGELLADRKEFAESRNCYEKANKLAPGSLSTAQNLATTLLYLGHTKEAEAKYREVLQQEPNHLDAGLNLICLLNGTGRYRDALAAVEDILARNPQLTKAYVIASAIECNLEHYPEALKFIEHAIALAPDQMQLLTRHAEILSKLGNHNLALVECDAVFAQFPSDVETLRVKATVLRALNRPAEALAALLAAEASASDPTSIAVDRAWLLGETGQKQDALKLLDTIISGRPDSAAALDCRSFLSRYKPDHPDVASMKRIVGKAETPLKDRARLSLSLGRIHLSAGDGEEAFHYLELGNKLKRSTIVYDRATEENWFSGIMETFSPDHMPILPRNDGCAARPIFVFGMPRSGTTLIEQILSSHPAVRGTGETPYMDRMARSSIFSQGLNGFSAENISLCTSQYLKAVGSSVPDGLRFVDKTNSNFLYAGLISLMLPKARMILCRRDPLDNCLSLYSLFFQHGHEFSYEQSELGHYYGLFEKMSAHWRNLLSSERLLEVNYEAVVNDTEAQTRRILDFCELPWDDACLRFHEIKRLVTTTSFDQVRSPIYKSSVGRANAFRPWMNSLIQALREHGVPVSD